MKTTRLQKVLFWNSVESKESRENQLKRFTQIYKLTVGTPRFCAKKLKILRV